MPRLGPRRPLQLGKSVVEFRLTAADADIKELLESEGNISATIRKALRLYALYRSGGLPVSSVPPQGMSKPVSSLQAGEATSPTSDLASATEGLLFSLEADWE